jgi:hypothetical protein
MGDQRFLAGQIRLSAGCLGFSARRNRLSLQTRGALCEDHCLSGGEIGRQRFSSVFHQTMESHPP